MTKHLVRHAIACATLKLAVDITVGIACVMAFGWLWSAAVTALVTGSRIYTAGLVHAPWRDLLAGDQS